MLGSLYRYYVEHYRLYAVHHIGLYTSFRKLISFTYSDYIMKMEALWAIALCTRFKVVRRLRAALFQRRASATSAYFKKSTRRYSPESCRLIARHRENLKSHRFHYDLY
jgi:hypothetical protein